MSKKLTKDEVITNKKEAIKDINKLLESFINSTSEHHLKKANLISYWLKDYVRLIHFEEKYDPKKNISYKRGNIVKLNFGFNIGSEYGGLHYGVVLDNHNAHNSPVITVIPLTSVKAGRTIHENNVELGNEIYRSLKLKFDTIYKALKKEELEITEMIKMLQDLNKLAQDSLDAALISDKYSVEYTQNIQSAESYLISIEKINATWEKRAEYNDEALMYLSKIGDEITNMKEGSIALVNQITTVSKMRIVDPRNLKGVLSGVSLSEESMKKLNQKVKKLYLFEQ